MKLVQIDDEDLRRNCVYGLGILAQHGVAQVAPLLGDVMGVLNGLYESAKQPGLRDNVVVALTRVLVYHYPSV